MGNSMVVFMYSMTRQKSVSSNVFLFRAPAPGTSLYKDRGDLLPILGSESALHGPPTSVKCRNRVRLKDDNEGSLRRGCRSLIVTLPCQPQSDI